MAAPEFVPRRPTDAPRSYASPPPRAGSWVPNRPSEVVDAGQPHGELVGSQGPDQGYAYKLARLFEDRLQLQELEDRRDVVAGCVAVGLKRASLFGRAPVVHDLTVAFTVWGFLDDSPSAELVAQRRRAFEGVRNPHHYLEQRELVDAVPESLLRLRPEAVAERYRAGEIALQLA